MLQLTPQKTPRFYVTTFAPLLTVIALASCAAAPAEKDSDVASAESGWTTGSCATRTTCDACAETSGCGFCDGRCVAGLASGPVQGSCKSYAYTPRSCSAPPVVTDAGTTPPSSTDPFSSV